MMNLVEVQKFEGGWDFYFREGDVCFPAVGLTYIQNDCLDSFSLNFGCCRLGGISIAESYAPQWVQYFKQRLTFCRSTQQLVCAITDKLFVEKL